MNLKQLQFALQVAQTRSFSRAAERCFSTQPTLSNGIAQLEQELGGKLFKRSTRKVELTDFGEQMLPLINDVLNSRDALQNAAEAYHNPEHKILRLGFSPLVDMQRLELALSLYKQTHPKVSIYFKECFLDDLSERLETGQIDLQIIPAKTATNGEKHCPFYQDPWRYLPAHGDEKVESTLAFEIANLPTTPIVLTGGGCGLNAAVKDLLESKGSTLSAYRGQAMTYKVIEDWSALGIGAGILPASKLSADDKSSIPLFEAPDKPAQAKFNWVWRDDKTHAHHVVEFLEYIQTSVPELLAGRHREKNLGTALRG